MTDEEEQQQREAEVASTATTLNGDESPRGTRVSDGEMVEGKEMEKRLEGRTSGR